MTASLRQISLTKGYRKTAKGYKYIINKLSFRITFFSVSFNLLRFSSDSLD